MGQFNLVNEEMLIYTLAEDLTYCFYYRLTKKFLVLIIDVLFVWGKNNGGKGFLKELQFTLINK